jgi:hypothetical protein
MTAEEAAEWGKTLSFEKVWAALMETDRIVKENAEKMRRSGEETDERIRRSSEETDRKLAEAAAQLWKKFDQFDFVFTKDSVNVKFRDKNGRVIAEVDIFLENGAYVMLVEVKLELTAADVDKHLERIEKVRRCMDERGDKRTIVAAVAGSIVDENVCEYAQDKGLYVLVPSGDSVAVANVPEGFTRKEW